MILAVASAYTIYDQIAMMFYTKDFGKKVMDYENSYHHVLVMVLYVGSIVVGENMLSVTAMSMICEISTVFLNVRYLIGKKHPCNLFVSILFFVLFTFLRIIYFPYLWLIMLASTIGLWAKLVIYKKVLYIVWLVIAFAVIALMYFWYYKIL